MSATARTAAAGPVPATSTGSGFILWAEANGLADTKIDGGVRWPDAIVDRNLHQSACGVLVEAEARGVAAVSLVAAGEVGPIIELPIEVAVCSL